MLCRGLLSMRQAAASSLRSLAVKKSVAGAGLMAQSSKMARQLSYSAARFSSSQQHQELVSALQNEIDAEKKLEQENLGGSSSPVVSGFKVHTDGAEVRLSKSHGEEQIMVVLNVNHSVDVENDFEDPETSVPISRPHFSIEVTKGSQRLCFEMDIIEAEEGQYDLQVDEFYVAPAAKGDNVDVEDKVYSSAGKFIDPGLHDLLFVQYLEERGFTSDFCNQLVNFSTHYEHSQYVNLLKNIKSFVGK